MTRRLVVLPDVADRIIEFQVSFPAGHLYEVGDRGVRLGAKALGPCNRDPEDGAHRVSDLSCGVKMYVALTGRDEFEEVFFSRSDLSQHLDTVPRVSMLKNEEPAKLAPLLRPRHHASMHGCFFPVAARAAGPSAGPP